MLHRFSNPPWIKALTNTLAFGFILFIAMASIHSLYFGVEPYDEAYYLAVPYSLIKGGRLFIDLYDIAQLAGMFTYPFLKLFLFLNRSTDGIFLFSRYLYFFFCTLVALILSLLLKSKLTLPISSIIGCVCIIFVPFNIHGLSYNTLGMLFLTTSLFVNVYIVSTPLDGPQKKRAIYRIYALFFLSGITQFFMVISYPPLLLLSPLICFNLWRGLSPKQHTHLDLTGQVDKETAFCFYGGALLLGALWVLGLFYKAGFNQIITNLATAKSSGAQGGGVNKVFAIATDLWLQLPHHYLIFSSLLFNLFIRRIKGVILLNSILLFIILIFIRTETAALYVRDLALLSPLLFLMVRESSFAYPLLSQVFIPSLCAGLLTSWSSSNGVYNAMIGFFPATLACLIFIAIQFSSLFNSFIKTEKYTRLLIAILLIFIIYPLKISNQVTTYGDLNTEQLKAKIVSGIYRGLYTTPKKKHFYEAMQNEIQKNAKNNHHILFFDDFPAGYLMTPLIPFTNTLWMFSSLSFPNFNRQGVIDYYQRKKQTPDIIVRIDNVAENPNSIIYVYQYRAHDPIQQLLNQYHLQLKTPDYSIFVKQSLKPSAL